MEKRMCIIPGYENRYWIYEDGSVYSLYRQRFLKPYIDKYSGYVKYNLTGDYRKYYHKQLGPGNHGIFSAHQLVAYHWHGPYPENKEIHHKDHNRTNNHYSNLEYVTHSENILKSYRDTNRVPYWRTHLHILLHCLL